jgi:hypothetical protein
VLQLNTTKLLSDSGFQILRLPPSGFLCSWDPETQISRAYTHVGLILTSLDFIVLSPKESLYNIWLSIRWKALDPDSKPFVKLVPQLHLESREAWIRRIAVYNSNPRVTLRDTTRQMSRILNSWMMGYVFCTGSMICARLTSLKLH